MEVERCWSCGAELGSVALSLIQSSSSQLLAEGSASMPRVILRIVQRLGFMPTQASAGPALNTAPHFQRVTPRLNDTLIETGGRLVLPDDARVTIVRGDMPPRQDPLTRSMLDRRLASSQRLNSKV